MTATVPPARPFRAGGLEGAACRFHTWRWGLSDRAPAWQPPRQDRPLRRAIACLSELRPCTITSARYEGQRENRWSPSNSIRPITLRSLASMPSRPNELHSLLCGRRHGLVDQAEPGLFRDLLHDAETGPDSPRQLGFLRIFRVHIAGMVCTRRPWRAIATTCSPAAAWRFQELGQALGGSFWNRASG